jgi:hypothetical protein
MASAIRAIDRLKNAANLVPSRKDVELSDATTFTFWSKPLTMAERDRAQRNAKSEDANAFALQLLVDKALDENGQKLFNAGDIADLRNAVRDADLQQLMLAVLTAPDDEAPLEPKSAAGGTK